MTLRERVEIMEKARSGGASAQAAHKELCRRDPAFFINTVLDIFEPRNKAGLRDLPYLLRKFQESTARAIHQHITIGEDLLIDKTREMGVTWLVSAVFVHGWIFEQGFTATVSSITEDKIDSKNDPSTLFWKIDYLIKAVITNAPWLLPDGFVFSQPNRTHMKIFNPLTNSVIRGEVMGANLGRSGRSKVIFLDEFAEAPFPNATWAACANTTNCRLVVFTPKGMNFAGRLANPERGKRAPINKITLHWMLDPSKNEWVGFDQASVEIARGHGRIRDTDLEKHPSIVQTVYPWYENAKRRLAFDSVKIAQELDVDYTESAEGLMYPQVNRAGKLDYIAYDPSLPLYCSMDFGLADHTALVWFQWDYRTSRFKIIDSFQFYARTIRWYIPFILGGNYGLGSAEGGYTEEQIKIIDRHAQYQGRYSDFFGDPAGRQKNQVTATSVIDVLAEYGINVRTNHYANNFIARKYALSSMLLHSDFSMDTTAELVDALLSSRQRPNGTPVHGVESHFRTAMEFAAVNQPHGNYGELPTTESDLLKYGESGLFGQSSGITTDSMSIGETLRPTALTDPHRVLDEMWNKQKFMDEMRSKVSRRGAGSGRMKRAGLGR